MRWLLLAAALSVAARTAAALLLVATARSSGDFFISRPTRMRDFEQIGSLMVSAFDDEPPLSSTPASAASSVAGGALWSLVGRRASASQASARYRDTVRRMQGKKYALLLAKEASTGDVLGMAEIGPTTIPGNATSWKNDDGSQGEKEEEEDAFALERVVCVGVLAVRPSERRRGIGRALMSACEDVASMWGENSIHVTVEPSNDKARLFFESLGFEGSGRMVSVKVSERLRTSERPHIVLEKKLARRG